MFPIANGLYPSEALLYIIQLLQFSLDLLEGTYSEFLSLPCPRNNFIPYYYKGGPHATPLQTKHMLELPRQVDNCSNSPGLNFGLFVPVRIILVRFFYLPYPTVER